MTDENPLTVQLIPVSLISIVNPRVRNKKSFRELVENIAALGLKKPITVTRRDDGQGVRYDLVCGHFMESYRLEEQYGHDHRVTGDIWCSAGSIAEILEKVFHQKSAMPSHD